MKTLRLFCIFPSLIHIFEPVFEHVIAGHCNKNYPAERNNKNHLLLLLSLFILILYVLYFSSRNIIIIILKIITLIRKIIIIIIRSITGILITHMLCTHISGLVHMGLGSYTRTPSDTAGQIDKSVKYLNLVSWQCNFKQSNIFLIA